MSKEYDNNLRGVLFRNNDKRPDKEDADYRGSCEINGVKFWIDSWINESKKDGSKFMALRFQPKQAQEHQGAAKNPPAAKADEFDDDISDIPF